MTSQQYLLLWAATLMALSLGSTSMALHTFEGAYILSVMLLGAGGALLLLAFFCFFKSFACSKVDVWREPE